MMVARNWKILFFVVCFWIPLTLSAQDTAPSELTIDEPTTEQFRQSGESLDVTYSYNDDNPS
ncbi:MAG: hypothetical protein V5A51_09465, partial [Bacteroidales bacterium]